MITSFKHIVALLCIATLLAIVGTGWGRTMEQMTLQLAGVSAPQARFISLMGSLTSNLAYNPFEVVHAFARTTGAEAGGDIAA